MTFLDLYNRLGEIGDEWPGIWYNDVVVEDLRLGEGTVSGAYLHQGEPGRVVLATYLVLDGEDG